MADPLKELHDEWMKLPEMERMDILKQALTTPMSREMLERIKRFEPITNSLFSPTVYEGVSLPPTGDSNDG